MNAVKPCVSSCNCRNRSRCSIRSARVWIWPNIIVALLIPPSWCQMRFTLSQSSVITLTRGKVMTDDWLNVNRIWHQLGGISSATMMFGHIQTLAERIEHLERLRQLQDETHGFTAFICWTFQPEHTEMANIPPSGAFEYLKTQAVARLYLDNFPNIQSSWVTQGLKVGQLALLYGANDMGSLMIEENVVAAAGTVYHLTLDEIKRAIRELGFEPRQRNVFYQLIDERPVAPPRAREL